MDTLHFERYEYKYLVPEEMTESIRSFIRPYVELDDRAVHAPDRRYEVHNLYLDTPNLDIYTTAANDAVDRFKLRIRWYDAGANGPFFYEVKRKVRQVILKDRARISREEVLAILRGEPSSLPGGPAGDNLASFLGRAACIGAVPTILLRYSREPYGSVFGEYARITLDRAMCFQPAHSYDFLENPRAWTYVDAAHATCGVRCAMLVELKFTREFPRWMSDLAAEFQLERIGCSKYMLSIGQRQEFAHGGMDFQRQAALMR